ncbi:geranylgeranylglyceryl/heptaprenylglyceryl phosphate synthase [Flaviaesturariibacter aridisoli]|uniref:Geranylgeranylglyceryl phosphate synthase n=1 Tax=Flaviaesturariibacter aridisoli TaxID=2545761 RepID=A0A4R4E3X7_9BACT|nr:geranylgeranylglyceryl/heptaprenylglyceryl phosphate synthase [Flaviaesturariibacter aridisoli]TCZ73637.1 geranylgeranylglyceryl/heptaprenylglyceryl phosphate synthase [Flaviaesturariibacter aridisoli]
MQGLVYQSLQEKKIRGAKSFALLIDPDKVTPALLQELVPRAEAAGVDYYFVGGSLVISDGLDECVLAIKALTAKPVVLFPGAPSQLSRHADALLYLSLISGRNPELLIGQHVLSAPFVKKSGLELMPTGYMVVDGGAPTTVSYISNAAPIPHDKADIALCTALAGEMLGLKLIYIDAGSGARRPVSAEMIGAVAQHIDVPLIVGGGIRTGEAAWAACQAGADVVVVGNAIEKDPALLEEIAAAVHGGVTSL